MFQSRKKEAKEKRKKNQRVCKCNICAKKISITFSCSTSNGHIYPFTHQHAVNTITMQQLCTFKIRIMEKIQIFAMDE